MRRLKLLPLALTAIILITLVPAACKDSPEDALSDTSLAEANFAWFFAPFFMSHEEWNRWDYSPDNILDMFFSDSSKKAGLTLPYVDFSATGSAIFSVDPSAPGGTFTFTPPGEVVDGRLTVTADGSSPTLQGEVGVFVLQFNGPILLQDPDHMLTYAAVFDSNGDPADNWQWVEPWDLDLYQGTDRWYELVWDPRVGEFQLMVNYWGGEMRLAWEANAPQEVESDAIAVIDNNLVVFFIPLDEFELTRPNYRLTAFGTDGSYKPKASGADVVGYTTTAPSLFGAPLSDWTIPIQVDFSFW